MKPASLLSAPFKSRLVMRSVVSLLVFLICIRSIDSNRLHDVLDEEDNTYPPHFVDAGETVRLTCLEHLPQLDQPPQKIVYRWFYERERINFENMTAFRLADQTRTLVIDDMDVSKQGKYMCVLMCRSNVRSETSKRYRRRMCYRKHLNVDRVVHKTNLLIYPPIETGYCDWSGDRLNKSQTQLPPDFRAYCTCHGGHEFECGFDMKLQRRKDTSDPWVDVTLGNRSGEVAFRFDEAQMMITVIGSKLGYEAAGFYRCVSFQKEGITCESTASIYLPSTDGPADLPAPDYSFELTWYVGVPVVVVTGIAFFILCTLILYFKFTTRIIVQSKTSSLIQRLTVPDSHLYPDLETEGAFF